MQLRRSAIALIALIAGLNILPVAAHAQGLAERRAIKEYQEKKLPDLKKQIDDAAGFDVKLTVDWDKLAVPGKADHYLEDEFISDIFFYPLIEALKRVTKDEMGKTALKSQLKEVVMTFDPATAPVSDYKGGWKFENGKLTINYEPWVNSQGRDTDEFKARVEAIQSNLEEKL